MKTLSFFEAFRGDGERNVASYSNHFEGWSKAMAEACLARAIDELERIGVESPPWLRTTVPVPPWLKKEIDSLKADTDHLNYLRSVRPKNCRSRTALRRFQQYFDRVWNMPMRRPTRRA